MLNGIGKRPHDAGCSGSCSDVQAPGPKRHKVGGLRLPGYPSSPSSASAAHASPSPAPAPPSPVLPGRRSPSPGRLGLPTDSDVQACVLRLGIDAADTTTFLGVSTVLARIPEPWRNRCVHAARPLHDVGLGGTQFVSAMQLLEYAFGSDAPQLAADLAHSVCGQSCETIDAALSILQSTAYTERVGMAHQLCCVTDSAGGSAELVLCGAAMMPIEVREQFFEQALRIRAFLYAQPQCSDVLARLVKAPADNRTALVDAVGSLATAGVDADQADACLEFIDAAAQSRQRGVRAALTCLLPRVAASPAWTGTHTLALTALLATTPAWAAAQVEKLLLAATTPETMRDVVQILTRVPTPRRGNAAKWIKALCSFPSRDGEAVLQTLKGVDTEDLQLWCKRAHRLAGNSAAPYRARIVRAFSRIQQQDAAEFLSHAAELFGNNLAGKHRLRIVRSLAEEPAERWGSFTTFAKRLFNGNNGGSRATMVEILRNEPPEERFDFVLSVERAAWRRASGKARVALANSLADLYQNQRDCVVEQFARLRPNLMDSEVAIAFFEFIADLPETDRVGFVDSLLLMGVMPMHYGFLRRPLEHVRASRRADFLEQCIPAAMFFESPAQLGATMLTLARLPAAERDAYLHSVMAVGWEEVDEENVMNTRSIARAHRAVGYLRALVPQMPARDATLDEIKKWMKNYFDFTGPATAAERAVCLRRRGFGTELQNAMHALEGYMDADIDFSAPLRDNPNYVMSPTDAIGLGDMLAMVWVAIEAYAGFEQDVEDVQQAKASMRYGVFSALAQCIEQDGHRVCGVGLSQRLLTVLQGRYKGFDFDLTPEPLVVLCESCSQFFLAQHHGESVAPQALHDFYVASTTYAGSLYPLNAPELHVFNEHLTSYLREDHGWSPSSPTNEQT